jgi:MoaA/NifB/PqqE/SkfB family radical SAM enzyme
MGLAQIVITGGEALMFPDLDAVIKACDPQKFYLELETNGWLMDEEKVEYLKAVGIDKVLVSLDSLSPEEHDAFRRKRGAYDRALQAIDLCIVAGLSTTVNTVVTKQRVRSEEFENFLFNMDTRGARVFAIYAHPVGEWQGNYDVLLDEDDVAYVKELGKDYAVFTHQTPGYGMNWGCIAVKRMFTITQYGDVKPCPFIDLSLGNVFAQPLKDIVERGMRAKCFQSDNCLIGTDREFIKKYLDDIKGEQLPVVFDEAKYQ